MTQRIRLSDLFLSPNFGPTEPRCMIYPNGSLDELEYGFGVERGWLLASLSKESELFKMIWEDINEDVFREIRRGRIALLPDSDVISKMLTLRHHNLYCPLRERIPFFEELPLVEYTYTLLPPILPSTRPLYIKSHDASLPLQVTSSSPLTKIQTRLHPLILLNHTAHYALMLQPRTELRHIVDQETFELLIKADTPSFGRVQESWLNLGDVEGNRKYSDRHMVYYIPDILRMEKGKKGEGKTQRKNGKVKKLLGESGHLVAKKKVKSLKGNQDLVGL